VTFDHGRATFQVTFATEGPQTVTASDEADAVTETASTNVAAVDEPTHFVVYLTQGATTSSPVTVQLLAEDAQNFVVNSYSGTVDRSSSDSGATLPASVTFENGHAHFQVTFASEGQQNITATDSATSGLTGVGTTNVVIPHFVIDLPKGVSAGVPVTV